MSDQESISLIVSFKDLPDPRVEGRCNHKLIDIIVIAVCGIIAGAETWWVDVADFGKAKQDWLKTFLDLSDGIPSHDTFGRVFAALDGEAFQTAFMRWVEGVFRVSKGQVIAIDGKTVRRSHDRTIGKDAIHMVNAWATQNGIALGQWKTDDKSNEITAIPKLLRQLNVAGCKANQGKLHQDIQDWFAYVDRVQFANMQHSYAETVNKGHGRIEIRRCWAINDPLAFDRNYDGWVDLRAIVRVQRERRLGEKTEQETAYYISSLQAEAEPLLTATRYHWAVENSLHWVLDVTFREDEARTRIGHAAHNMAILRQLALNILKKADLKESIRRRRKIAALDTTYLEKILAHV